MVYSVFGECLTCDSNKNSILNSFCAVAIFFLSSCFCFTLLLVLKVAAALQLMVCILQSILQCSCMIISNF